MTNLTLSIDDHVLEEARKKAVEQGTSVNQKVREFLEHYSGVSENQKQAVEELEQLWEESEMLVGEKGWNREDIYKDRLNKIAE